MFTLAVNRVVAGQDGPKADYIPCSYWGEDAQEFARTRGTGDEVGVIGRLRCNYVQQADGSSRPFFEVRAEEVKKGRVSKQNLQPAPQSTPITAAVSRLQEEFGA
jgi:single-stranded DNA-binding protein